MLNTDRKPGFKSATSKYSTTMTLCAANSELQARVTLCVHGEYNYQIFHQ